MDTLYRGKDIKNGEWVYGNYREITKAKTIAHLTVCEWTGFYDKNGTKVFAKDIAKYTSVDGVEWEVYINVDEYFGATGSLLKYGVVFKATKDFCEKIEIIGNCFDREVEE